MRPKHAALLSLVMALAAALFASRSGASAQNAPAGAAPAAGAQKIATANPSKIFFGMKEKNDVQQRLAEERKKLVDEERSKRQKVEDLRSALELLKPDAPQFEAANKEYTEAAIAFKNWGEYSQLQSARSEKQQTKMLFDKITAAVAELAKQRGIDLVIAEQPPINIERISAEQLTQFMAQRQVLYTNANVDLTAEVIAHLDEKYNAQQKK
jgi:Skp family chaperone for outer membrane proteins